MTRIRLEHEGWVVASLRQILELGDQANFRLLDANSAEIFKENIRTFLDNRTQGPEEGRHRAHNARVHE
ncbi:hypothetical protein [Bosea lathyri]|uniref:Uncharacterized protein n=1 Tax=Bosea lathyri TaxID=1036778 RepID=A0A1H6AD30_9HYPH|nr:hypothetical protein [Bosea lathyri]SEG46282.1 hypothetical protein SAMN04488115_105356 [Bosea lathyri]